MEESMAVKTPTGVVSTKEADTDSFLESRGFSYTGDGAMSESEFWPRTLDWSYSFLEESEGFDETGDWESARLEETSLLSSSLSLEDLAAETSESPVDNSSSPLTYADSDTETEILVNLSSVFPDESLDYTVSSSEAPVFSISDVSEQSFESQVTLFTEVVSSKSKSITGHTPSPAVEPTSDLLSLIDSFSSTGSAMETETLAFENETLNDSLSTEEETTFATKSGTDFVPTSAFSWSEKASVDSGSVAESVANDSITEETDSWTYEYKASSIAEETPSLIYEETTSAIPHESPSSTPEYNASSFAEESTPSSMEEITNTAIDDITMTLVEEETEPSIHKGSSLASESNTPTIARETDSSIDEWTMSWLDDDFNASSIGEETSSAIPPEEATSAVPQESASGIDDWNLSSIAEETPSFTSEETRSQTTEESPSQTSEVSRSPTSQEATRSIPGEETSWNGDWNGSAIGEESAANFSDSLDFIATTPASSMPPEPSRTDETEDSAVVDETEAEDFEREPESKPKGYLGYVMTIVVTGLVGSSFFVYSVHLEIVLARRRFRNTVVGIVKNERRKRRRKLKRMRSRRFYSV
jgi:epidermal growth factor receptor substrate 15